MVLHLLPDSEKRSRGELGEKIAEQKAGVLWRSAFTKQVPLSSIDHRETLVWRIPKGEGGSLGGPSVTRGTHTLRKEISACENHFQVSSRIFSNLVYIHPPYTVHENVYMVAICRRSPVLP